MEIGDVVQDFTLDDQYGVTQRLYGYLEHGPVVLFFYPAALSKGCTEESCHFRDLKTEFEDLGAQRLGISVDSVDKQRKFSDRHSFDYPLLSDTKGAVAKQFGVKRSLDILKVKRWTFVIGSDHRLKEVIKSEVRMDAHADRALGVLRQLSSVE
jgi:peroxiredoxin Q/BCP